MPVLSKIWDTIRGWAAQNAQHLIYAEIPDPNATLPAVVPYKHYFRVWLAEMFLTDSRSWFQNWHPAVNSQVRLKFAGKNDVTFSHITSPKEEKLGAGVYQNFPVTELMPYNGGVVEIQAGLLALKGDNALATTIKVLKGFSSLVSAPLGQALALADQVTSGLGDLVDATSGEVHLGFHQTFAAAGGGGVNHLKPGYIAVVLAPAAGNLKGELRVVGDRLHRATGGGAPTPLHGFDYMLFRIEGRDQRDDWRLRNIEEPLDKAVEALGEGDLEKAARNKTQAIVSALLSPDLAVADRTRVVEAIKQELAVIQGTGLGAVGGQPRDLNAIMGARAMPIAQAQALGEMTLTEALG